jgi:hypothetical protein
MRFAANAALLIMKSMIGAREVNATRQNKRFLIEPMRLRRINSSKDGLRRQKYFCAVGQCAPAGLAGNEAPSEASTASG